MYIVYMCMNMRGQPAPRTCFFCWGCIYICKYDIAAACRAYFDYEHSTHKYIKNTHREVLLISGSGPKKQLDAVSCLERCDFIFIYR